MSQKYDFTRFTKKQLQAIAAEAGLRKNWAPISIFEMRGMLSLVELSRMRRSLIRAGVAEHEADDLLIDAEDEGEYAETELPDADDVTDVTPKAAPVAAPHPSAPATSVDAVADALRNLLASGGTNEVRVAEIAREVVSDAQAAMRAFVADQIAEVSKNLPTVTYVQPTIGEPKKITGLVHVRFERVYKLASLRQNIMLVGPAGCGKTQLAEQVAEALGLSFSFLSCSAGMSESQLQGWLLPTGDNGQFDYVPAAFVNAYENGGLFLMDEMDAADENLLLVINAALANGKFSIPSRFGNPIAIKHPDFVFMGACNTFGLGADRVYAGRNQLDGATLDRFRCGMTTMDYDANVESQLIDPEVLAWGALIRAKINANKLRRVMSTRVLIGYSAQKAAGFTRADWEESYFCDWSRDELSKVGR